MELKSNSKILIIRLSALGDSIHTLPLASALKKQYPDIELDWVVEDKASAFIENNPLINQVYIIRRKNRLRDYLEVIKQIRKKKYDIVLDTQQLLKSSVIMGFSGAKRKITLDGGREFSFIFANEIIKTGRKQFDINYHVVKRNLDFAKYLGCKDLETKFIIPNFDTTINIQNNGKKVIVIAPATTWDNKHWMIEGWSEVINKFKDRYKIVITGSEKDKALTDKILEQVDGGDILNLTGQTQLSDLVNIYRNAEIVISPDSGSAHIAWASGAKCIITLFFATSANRTAPYGDNYYSISSKALCSPCMKKHCSQKNKINNCIGQIKSDEIINIVKKVMQE